MIADAANAFGIMLETVIVDEVEVLFGPHRLCDRLPRGALIYLLGESGCMRLIGALQHASAYLSDINPKTGELESPYLHRDAKLCKVNLAKQLENFTALYKIAKALMTGEATNPWLQNFSMISEKQYRVFAKLRLDGLIPHKASRPPPYSVISAPGGNLCYDRLVLIMRQLVQFDVEGFIEAFMLQQFTWVDKEERLDIVTKSNRQIAVFRNVTQLGISKERVILDKERTLSAARSALMQQRRSLIACRLSGDIITRNDGRSVSNPSPPFLLTLAHPDLLVKVPAAAYAEYMKELAKKKKKKDAEKAAPTRVSARLSSDGPAMAPASSPPQAALPGGCIPIGDEFFLGAIDRPVHDVLWEMFRASQKTPDGFRNAVEAACPDANRGESDLIFDYEEQRLTAGAAARADWLARMIESATEREVLPVAGAVVTAGSALGGHILQVPYGDGQLDEKRHSFTLTLHDLLMSPEDATMP